MARPSNQMSDPALLAAALEGLELQRKRIDAQMATVRSMMSGRKAAAPATASETAATAAPKAPKAPKATKTRKKRVLSEEARLRIAAAQKKRWANFRKVK